VKTLFFNKYKIKFLGDADWLLNMRIRRDRVRRLLFLDQQSYVDSLLEEFSLDECNCVSHPGSNVELSLSQCPISEEEKARMKRFPYRRVIGLLTYLSNLTRPDIAYSVNLCSQYSQNPGEQHWNALVLILRYLCGTRDFTLCFDGNAANRSLATPLAPLSIPPLVGYSDSSWGNCPDTRRSTTGWIIKLGNSVVDWNVHKQETVAISSCEAEYMAMVSITQAMLWTRSLLQELRDFFPSPSSSSPSSPVPIIMGDNKSAISMSKNDVMHQRTKHIDIKHHFIRDEIQKGTIQIQWISTHEQLADILTKRLNPFTFRKLRDQLLRRFTPLQ
jgi:hypothetical protein